MRRLCRFIATKTQPFNFRRQALKSGDSKTHLAHLAPDEGTFRVVAHQAANHAPKLAAKMRSLMAPAAKRHHVIRRAVCQIAIGKMMPIDRRLVAHVASMTETIASFYFQPLPVIG